MASSDFVVYNATKEFNNYLFRLEGDVFILKMCPFNEGKWVWISLTHKKRLWGDCMFTSFLEAIEAPVIRGHRVFECDDIFEITAYLESVEESVKYDEI